ncbi:class I SAM-dependent methyltransferase [Nonomuraea sp. NBC_00507]|uniref:class I SAM-dependent methyltransferase n=1 Tax=Nonomuraea sp. NBC_00507 TaxID=2976002 RepID=UPI002E183EF8
MHAREGAPHRGASRTAPAVALSARFMDRWATEFLAAHPGATVLHLGCGLDTRFHRLAPPPTVRWYDVDYPEVVELRRRLFPEPPGYTMIGSSVTELTWLDQIPADRPVLVVADGLFYYLDPGEGRALLRAIVEHRGPGRPGSDPPEAALSGRDERVRHRRVRPSVDATSHRDPDRRARAGDEADGGVLPAGILRRAAVVPAVQGGLHGLRGLVGVFLGTVPGIHLVHVSHLVSRARSKRTSDSGREPDRA